MSYVTKSLLPDEKILFQTGKHWIIFYIPALWAVMAAAFHFTPNALVAKLAILPALVMLVTGFNQWLIYISAEFAITSRRIIMREGFFFRHMTELRLATVSNMTVNQSLIGQMLGYGTLVVSPFGGTNDIFSEISRPFEFQKAAQAQLDLVASPAALSQQQPPSTR